MSHAPALNPSVKTINPQTELPTPTLPFKSSLRGAEGGGEPFLNLLETPPKSSVSDRGFATHNAPLTNATVDASDGNDDAVSNDDRINDDRSEDTLPKSSKTDTAPRTDTAAAPTPQPTPSGGGVNPAAPDNDARTLARANTEVDSPARLRDALPAGAVERSPAAGLARPDDLDAPRASGADLRQQRLWDQAQQHATSPRDGATALPVLNPQAAGDAAALSAAMAAMAAADPQTAGTMPRGGDDLVTMLQNLCSQMYVTQGPDPSNARMLLDLGHTLPGSLVELAREGAFLRVRLHAADTQAGALMEAQRDRLIAALAKSTRMGVMVDVVRPR